MNLKLYDYVVTLAQEGFFSLKVGSLGRITKVYPESYIVTFGYFKHEYLERDLRLATEKDIMPDEKQKVEVVVPSDVEVRTQEILAESKIVSIQHTKDVEIKIELKILKIRDLKPGDCFKLLGSKYLCVCLESREISAISYMTETSVPCLGEDFKLTSYQGSCKVTQISKEEFFST